MCNIILQKTKLLSKIYELVCSVLIGLCLLSNGSIRAQAPIFKQKFYFPQKQITVYEIANLLKQQSDLSVSFDAQQLKSNTKVKLPKLQMTTQELAVLLAKEYQIESKFIGRHIILKKVPQAISPKAKSKIAKNKPSKKRQEKAKIAKSELVNVKGEEIKTPVNSNNLLIEKEVFENTIYFADTFTMGGGAIATYGFSVGSETAEMSFDKHFDRLDEPEITNINPNWYERFGLSLGLQSDEYVFVKPSLNIHFAGLQLGVGYAMKSKLNHWQFELGYRHHFTNKFSLYLNGVYGILPQSNLTLTYSYDSIPPLGPDSVPTAPVTVTTSKSYELETQRLQLRLSANYILADKWDLELGIGYNILNTKIVHNGIEQAPAAFLPNNAAFTEANFLVLPDRLSLSSDFNTNRSSFNKHSLGGYVGIRFYLFRGKRNQE